MRVVFIFGVGGFVEDASGGLVRQLDDRAPLVPRPATAVPDQEEFSCGTPANRVAVHVYEPLGVAEVGAHVPAALLAHIGALPAQELRDPGCHARDDVLQGSTACNTLVAGEAGGCVAHYAFEVLESFSGSTVGFPRSEQNLEGLFWRKAVPQQVAGHSHGEVMAPLSGKVAGDQDGHRQLAYVGS
jgi:hypothetical protein